MRETELYAPVKAFLDGQGYEVKSEVGPADVVACRDGDDPVVIELKTGFSLTLVHQAVARQSLTDAVYIAVPRGKGRAFLTSLKNMKKLCRRLGLGLLTVRMSDDLVEVHCDPGPFQPRKSKLKRERLLGEFAKRSGDRFETQQFCGQFTVDGAQVTTFDIAATNGIIHVIDAVITLD